MPYWLKIMIIVVGVCISWSGTIVYIKDIIARKTQPHIYTWIIWFITQGVGILGMWQGGAGLGVWSLTIGMVGLTIIIGLSIKHGTKDITQFDTILLIGGISAIGLRFLTDNPLRSIIIVSCVDLIGYIPSMRKTLINPHSETLISWIGYCINNIFVILVIEEYNVLTLLYISVISLCNLGMVIIIISRRMTLSKHSTL